MRRRASPLHALLVPAPPPAALEEVATGAAICIRPHGPVVRTLPRVAHSMRAARAEAANSGLRRHWRCPIVTKRESRMHCRVPASTPARTFAALAVVLAAAGLTPLAAAPRSGQPGAHSVSAGSARPGPVAVFPMAGGRPGR